MKKNYVFLLFAIMCFAGKSHAQTVHPCYTDEMTKKYKQLNPQLAVDEKKLEEQIQEYIKAKRNPNSSAYRTTAGSHADTDWYDIPVVVHIVHNGGPELLADDKVYALITEMNNFYSLQYNYSSVIAPFKPYVAKAKFRFHLASKDPSGNPTNGITHRVSYLTYGYDDQAKIDQWPPSSYINIWFEYVIGQTTTGGIIVAYATQPATAALFPPNDGIISNYSFINDGAGGAGGGSIDHEMGHILNLYHTFGHTNNPHTNSTGNCSDDDGVDDTPPTEGNLGGCHLYDSICATNYFKLYTNAAGGDSLVNYPDTSNEQNIMNYADCKVMFTKGQVERMRAALNNNTGGRKNLWDSTNLMLTGIWDASFNFIPKPDLKPNPEFSVTPVGSITSNTNYMNRMSYFTCPGTTISFHNNTWNDTVTSLNWTFSNDATSPTATSLTTVTNAFATSGWVTVSMKATGNNSGDTTATWANSVYVADAAATPAASFVQAFGPTTSDKWPSFNYFKNGFKWQIANTGLYDGYSMMYTGYDTRFNPAMGLYPNTGSPAGDFDDFFSVPVDFSGYTPGFCSLTFDYSGASRSSNSLDINDEFDIDYSIDHAATWTNLVKMVKGGLENKGAISTPYVPNFISDWAHKSVAVPATAMTNYTVFRFRYKPNNGQTGYSSGNNFYLDNFFISPFPAAVGNVVMNEAGITVVPNPTGGDAFVILKDAANTVANITVTDVTGKVVYTTSEQVLSNLTQIEIPHTAISVKGLYIVQAITGAKTYTQKLVVY